ncbi:mucin-13b isoform X2 [Pseudorasbora parva]|uniref:mucin-13b isoform X2 n=1 Tax=Pseudorasbora parva TaxID=51549 RepID=UPI00351E2FB3
MNIPPKTLLICCLLVAVSTQDPPGTMNNGAFKTDTESNSTAANTTSTQAPVTKTTGTLNPTTTSNSTVDTSASTNATTQAPVTKTTGTLNPTTTSNSTVDTSASTNATTQAPETTATVTFNTTSNSTDDTSATTSTATTTTTTQAPNPCVPNPCIGGVTCEQRFDGFACICRPGLVYLERGCALTKVFPGNLTVKGDFVPEMENKQSKQFQETASQIEKALKETLRNEDGYVNSIVFQLRSGSIIAEVQNFYDLSSPATSETVEKLIQANTDFEQFKPSSACDVGVCDSSTTSKCTEDNGNVMCDCSEGFINSEFTSHSCIPCPNGQKAEEGKCKNCPFGYAGFNCNDPFLLVVVVVSTVLGALLIIFIVALIFVSCRNPKESSSSQVDFSSNYGNAELHKPTGVPRIPRANPDASWKSNSLEMTNSGSNQALVTRDHPDSKTVRTHLK